MKQIYINSKIKSTNLHNAESSDKSKLVPARTSKPVIMKPNEVFEIYFLFEISD